MTVDGEPSTDVNAPPAPQPAPSPAPPAADASASAETGGRRGGGRWTTAVVCALLAIYAAVAWAAVRDKVATADEAAHLAASIVNLRHLDFRANREDPPLWKYWAALPHLVRPPTVTTSGDDWYNMPTAPGRQYGWSINLLYRTPGNDPDALLARSRAMMLVLAVALGGLIAWWAWRLGGAVAAVVAAALFALDPNFLAHGPLMKNDVALALGWTAVTYELWRLGRRLSGAGMFRAAFVCGLTALLKFSALLVGPLVAVLLVIRALLPMHWEASNRGREGAGRRLGLALGVVIAIGLVGYLLTWAAYGARYRMTPGYHAPLNWNELMARSMAAQARGANPGAELTPELISQYEPGFVARELRNWGKLKLAPEAWSNGLLYTYTTVVFRRSYLMGAYSETGWVYYFPLAMLLKTPLATLAALLGAAVVALALARPARRGGDAPVAVALDPVETAAATSPAAEPVEPAAPASAAAAPDRANVHPGLPLAWSVVCLLVPGAVFMGFAMWGNMNIGLRHVLAIYPMLFVAAGWAAAAAVRRWRGRAAVPVVLLLAGVAAETAAAFPHYIPFFNPIAGDARRQMHLLADSNLDWGQDLKALVKWRAEHPDGTLYLSYFGYVDPAYYGLDFVPLPGTTVSKRGAMVTPADVRSPGYVALSVSSLQGINLPPEQVDTYAAFRDRQPDWVLGRTIYVYRLPLPFPTTSTTMPTATAPATQP